MVCEDVGEGLACYEFDQSMDKLLQATSPSSFKLFITGDTNFRYNIFPEYKMGRINKPRPKHLQAVKDYAIRKWDATPSVGCEADDLLAIEQTSYNVYGDIESCISSIDKDLDQVSGRHYHPGIKRNQVWIREPKFYTVSPLDAHYAFYYQLLMGDGVDGVKGVKNIGKKKAAAILANLTTEEEMFNAVREAYGCDEEMLMNGQCLWLWRKPDDTWQFPVFE